MPNALAEDCPSRHVLSVIGDRWSVLILLALAGGPRRHGELRRTISGASQKMLTQTLRALERDGLLSRTETPGRMPRVDYGLTPLAKTLVPLLEPLKQWADVNVDAMLAGREDFLRRGA